jgi:hypothetical protein
VAAAAACGMTGVHHTETAQTVAALQDLLGVPLDAAGLDAAGLDAAGLEAAGLDGRDW